MKKCNTFLWLALFMLFFSPIVKGQKTEKLLGITLDNDKQEITIHVVSSGCTQKTDFSFEMKRDTLTILRIKNDDCKAMGSEVHFSWSLKEAGINPNKPFVIRNKFIVNPFIAKIQ